MQIRYEVQTWTLCDGWINTWSVSDETGEAPETFATREEAQAALDEFLRDIQDEIEGGQRGADEGYDPADFRVEEVQQDPPRRMEIHRFEWGGILLEVSYEPQWLSDGDIAHLEVRSISPERAPLPITETGYRSHFTTASAIEAAGGPVAFVDVWLAAESQAPKWRKREQSARQLSLL
jgi:hypothetical protein